MSRHLLLIALAAISPALGARADSSTNLSITVRVLGTDGQACTTAKCFWRAVEGEGETKASDKLHGMSEPAHRWHDRITGKTWQPIHCYGAGEGTTTETKLAFGDYRVTATLGFAPAPFGISEVIHLDRTRPQADVVFRLQAGSKLMVSAMELQTRKSIPIFQALLVRDDGFPVTQWSGGSWFLASKEGQLNFSQLPPGNYRLEVRRPAFNADEPEYTSEKSPIDIQVSAGADQHITAPLKAVPLPDEVIRRRWPYVITGRVTDKQGQGLAGVAIFASCGFGTMLPTGGTTSRSDGRYTLRFHEDSRGTAGALQHASIGANKSGYVVDSRSCQGPLLIAGQMPKPGERTRYTVDPAKVVLPEQPFGLDFVMVPAATVKGRLVDAQNRPLARERIYLCNQQVHTDADGRFQFDNVSPRTACGFSLPERGNVGSRTVTAGGPVVLNIHLRFTSQNGKPTLELTETSEK